nr:hypothetical protein [Chloroflexota bacterium]
APDGLLRVWPGLGADPQIQAGVVGVILLLPLFGWRWLARAQRRAVLTWLVFAFGLAAGAFAFVLLYETYVPLRVGPRRLLPYELFVPVVFLAIDLLLLQRLVHWVAGRALAGRANVMRSAVGVVVVAVIALFVARAPLSQGPVGEEDESFGLERTGYDAYGWIAQNTPPGSRILTSAYTDGIVAALTRRVGIVDGRAVYLEDAPFLREALEHLLGARVVFGAPAAPGAVDYLRDERVDYLLVTGPEANGRTLGGYPVFEVDLAALDAQPYLRLLLTFGDDRLRLYEVEVDSAATITRGVHSP